MFFCVVLFINSTDSREAKATTPNTMCAICRGFDPRVDRAFLIHALSVLFFLPVQTAIAFCSNAEVALGIKYLYRGGFTNIQVKYLRFK